MDTTERIHLISVKDDQEIEVRQFQFTHSSYSLVLKLDCVGCLVLYIDSVYYGCSVAAGAGFEES